jgi:hypothetical protein
MNKSTKVVNGRTYTHRNSLGQLARVIATDIKNQYPVVALVLDVDQQVEVLHQFTANLQFYRGDNPNEMDLIQGAEPEFDWTTVTIDTPVWVLNRGWGPAHFAGVCDGRVCTFSGGCTSHTATASICTGVISWDPSRVSLTKPPVA